MRHKTLFPEHLFVNAFAVTSMMNFGFLEHLFSTSPNVQEQLFIVDLRKIVLKSFNSKKPAPDPLF